MKSIENAINYFLKGGEILAVEEISAGNINSTYKVVYFADGKKSAYVFQRINTYVFKNPEQLMDIYRFDQEKYDGLRDLVAVSPEHMTPYPLWTLPADSLQKHPYIGDMETARAIVLYRENSPVSQWTMESLIATGILDSENAAKMARCLIEAPSQ